MKLLSKRKNLFMLPFLTKSNEDERSEKFLTLPVIILLLLMITFFGSGVYLLAITYFA